jgi:hypothetical protein
MDFEEFFKKKRIDLVALNNAEPSLFSEFKMHFDQMGEKSFDHTKKYWFNKLRRQFHLAPELKPEKAHIENPLAEQTVTESLIENVTALASPKLGFVPKFKAGNIPKAPNEGDKKHEMASAPSESSAIVEKPVEPESVTPAPSPKPGFVPRFKAANMPKPMAAEDKKEEMRPVGDNKSVTDEVPAESRPPKPAYKPRFNMKNIPPKAEE